MSRLARRLSAVAATLGCAVGAGCARGAPLLAPSARALGAVAPDSFHVVFETTRGPIVVLARRAWSPIGVDRLHYLARHHFYDGGRFFRVVRHFVVQFGIPGDPAVAAAWSGRSIPDEPVRASNRRGTVAYARGGPGTRTTQLFINLRDNPRLDTLNGIGFPPVGEVVDGMAVVDSLYAGYGEAPPRGTGPRQDSIRVLGEPYLARRFPRLDRILSVRVTR